MWPHRVPARSILLPLGLLAVPAALTRTADAQQAAAPESLYTQAQADRGHDVYRAQCAECHGQNLNDGGVVPLAGPAFIQNWSRADRSLGDLYYITRTTMPRAAGGSLSEREYIDVLAYILERNGYPAGETPLTTDQAALGEVYLTSAPMAAAARAKAPPPEFIPGEKGLEPSGSGPTQEELLAAHGNTSDWLYHTHDYTGRRYVDLSEITPANVGRLQVACAYQVGDLGYFQTGPIVYRGVMYVTTLHTTAAIDATTCREKWRHTWEPLASDVWPNQRGVAIKDGRVVRATSDGYLFALDAATGEPLWTRRIADAALGETITMAPMIFEDLVLIGPAGSENNISGWVGAFRLSDGSPVWRFKTVPGAGEPGNESWPNPTGIPLGGGAVWTPLALDVEKREVYVAVTNPAPDLPAHLRPGPNLYTNSLVALDVSTGKLKWYEQLVPNDSHDWDLTQVSPLFEADVRGQRRKLVATVGKDGILRVLDRETRERLYQTPITTQQNVDVPLSKEGVLVCPGLLGGVEWNGPAYNPRANLLYVNAVDWCTTFALEDSVRFVEGELYVGGTFELAETSQGWLTAVDASTGRVAWRYRSARPMVSAITTTGGGLVFTGELDGDFMALDARSGKVLYRLNTGGPIGGGVVSYALGGKQYAAVASGRASLFFGPVGAPTVFVFALPND
ncbi:MAG TPA: PQQ-binding-like beta-propeller repeat protein [Gemmatimonadales bacterium]|nr:PQQ-binding-like beta-propeller repeat protein [Gemmatimonadales bacterium]